VAYGVLFSADLAKYARRDPLHAHPNTPHALRQQAMDGSSHQDAVRRYFAVKAVMAEHNRRTRRVHVPRRRHQHPRTVTANQLPPLPEFISIHPPALHGTGPAVTPLPTTFGEGGGSRAATAVVLAAAAAASAQAAAQEAQAGESTDEWVRRRTRELNEAARRDPKDVNAWLELVTWQDEAAALMQSASRYTPCSECVNRQRSFVCSFVRLFV
jgi:hypothetical protein